MNNSKRGRESRRTKPIVRWKSAEQQKKAVLAKKRQEWRAMPGDPQEWDKFKPLFPEVGKQALIPGSLWILRSPWRDTFGRPSMHLPGDSYAGYMVLRRCGSAAEPDGISGIFTMLRTFSAHQRKGLVQAVQDFYVFTCTGFPAQFIIINMHEFLPFGSSGA